VRSLKLHPEIEARLRQNVLQYFLDPGYTAAMALTEPFLSDLANGVYTLDQLAFMRRSLWTAGLLEHVRGTTRDTVLVITEQGREFLKREKQARKGGA
jgi:hypothetical protein